MSYSQFSGGRPCHTTCGPRGGRGQGWESMTRSLYCRFMGRSRWAAQTGRGLASVRISAGSGPEGLTRAVWHLALRGLGKGWWPRAWGPTLEVVGGCAPVQLVRTCRHACGRALSISGNWPALGGQSVCPGVRLATPVDSSGTDQPSRGSGPAGTSSPGQEVSVPDPLGQPSSVFPTPLLD